MTQANTLVLSSGIGAETHETCHRLLGEDVEETCFLLVNYTQSAEGWLDEFEGETGTRPWGAIYVNLGGTAPGGSYSRPDFGELTEDDHVIEVFESPQDLTGLGILLSEYLLELDDLRWNGGPTRTSFCFDSITLLLQYVDADLAFRFLHVLTTRLAEYGVPGHFHLDPDAHDDQTVATFTQLFDDVVDA